MQMMSLNAVAISLLAALFDGDEKLFKLRSAHRLHFLGERVLLALSERRRVEEAKASKGSGENKLSDDASTGSGYNDDS